MFADLKEKAARIDRKRVYTAAAALLIAGAAGHFMQKTANGPAGTSATVTASAPPVSAPEILPAPGATPATTPETAAAALEPAPVGETAAKAATLAGGQPPAPASSTPDAMTAGATPEPVAPEPIIAAALPSTRPVPKPDIAPGLLAETGTASTAIYPAPKVGPIIEEVTRAATDPLLTINEPAPERPEDAITASAADPLDMTTATDAAPAEPAVASCAIDAEATAKPGALIEIRINAPCNAGETVDFEHAGLKFSEQLWPDGSLTVEVPAMMESARVAMHFTDGADKDVEVTVPDFDAYDRMAVIWKGATGLQLHVFENGADYGEPGHLWADTPGTPDAAVSGAGGFISVLGSSTGGYAADVYTFPAALSRKGEEPEVSIEAQVMENTCGGEIEGWILRTNPNRPPIVEPLEMVVPGCEAVGEYLVLRNLPVELKLARK